MIKQSSILKWTHNNRHNHKGVREWIHPPDTLQRGHIAYLVKFLGSTEVEQAKGIDVVKEGIRKLKFTSQIKKSEGTKPPKVELTISIDGVAIQEPKTKRILHQYPLHRISYCADDKAEKKFFSFIAKEADCDKHICFVFVSDKLAEEITLTIGQAFDLAYRRFLESSGRDLEMRKQLMILQKKIQSLEDENRDLKQRLTDLQKLKNNPAIETYKEQHKITDLCLVNGDIRMEGNSYIPDNATKQTLASLPAIPPRPQTKAILSPSQELFNELGPTLPAVGTKLENLSLDEFDDFNPRGNDDDVVPPSPSFNGLLTPVPCLQPPALPPPVLNGNNHVHMPPSYNANSGHGKDLFGAEPFSPCSPPPPVNPQYQTTGDPFGMGDFGQIPSHFGAQELETAIGALDKRLSEMRDGFKRGISFGNDDFSLESLDPLNNKPPVNE